MKFHVAARALLLGLVAVPVHSESATMSGKPLTGTWVMCQDPDHSPPDSLTFHPEGYGFEHRPDKPKYPFLFKETGEKLLLLVNARGDLIQIHMMVNPARTRLFLKSDKTGSESFYVRQGQEKENSCSTWQPHF
ncbi:hypothetical protein [Frateuria sp. Soil773]|uniref:hypothetical protein n=1 Tax=Frateuria sp. Soil773 TaxID=1736407 RepID=UPI0012F72C8A|nr:hypothetical protein [Frateuria sp. Soil773]